MQDIRVMSEKEVRELVCKFYSQYAGAVTRIVSGWKMGHSTLATFLHAEAPVRKSTIEKIGTKILEMPVDWSKVEISEEYLTFKNRTTPPALPRRQRLGTGEPKVSGTPTIGLEHHIVSNQIEELRAITNGIQASIDKLLSDSIITNTLTRALYAELTGEERIDYREEVTNEH